jgi:hypothetical protein
MFGDTLIRFPWYRLKKRPVNISPEDGTRQA